MKAGRVALAVCAVGSLGAVAGGVALANGGQNAAAGVRPATRGTSGARTESAGLLMGFGAGYGRGSGFARSTCGAGVAGQVTSVSGNTINLTGRRAGAVAVTVGATTVYTEAQQAASLADVHTGLLIMACGTGSSTNVQATKIYIVLPRIGGVVTNVSGSTLTLTSLDGATRTVTVSNATTYDKAGHSASLGDITNGTAIAAQGSVGSDGVLSAVRVDIQTPRVAGQVTGVNGSTITLSNARGMNGMSGVNGTSGMSGTTTVVTSDQTTYSVISATAGMTPTTTTGMAGDVKSGVSIIAQGTLRSDGKTLDALHIVVLPANTGAYAHHGRHGFFGRGSGGAGGSYGPRGGFSRGFGSGGFSGSGGNPAGSPDSGFGDPSPAGGWNGGAPNSGATVGTANA
jgi:hypothetical protein